VLADSLARKEKASVGARGSEVSPTVSQKEKGQEAIHEETLTAHADLSSAAQAEASRSPCRLSGLQD
jgi:hypothetical protein